MANPNVNLSNEIGRAGVRVTRLVSDIERAVSDVRAQEQANRLKRAAHLLAIRNAPDVRHDR